MKLRQARKIAAQALSGSYRERIVASLADRAGRAARRLHRAARRRCRAWYHWDADAETAEALLSHAWRGALRAGLRTRSGAWGSAEPWPQSLQTLADARTGRWPKKKGGDR